MGREKVKTIPANNRIVSSISTLVVHCVPKTAVKK
jgi:hypothetical protein